MKTFKDSATGQYWQFADDVIVTQENEANVFTTAAGVRLDVPPTLVEADAQGIMDPAPTLDGVRAAQLLQINVAFEASAAALTAGYPEAERLTWPTQQTEALAWGADNTTPTPYLDGIAAARGIDPAQMRSLTLAQVQAFQTASQQLVGTRQKLRDAIDAAGTIEAVQAIVWPA